LSHVFATHDLAAITLGRGDVPRLQALFQRCADFIQLVYRRSVGPREASELLEELPPGKTLEDKFVFGLETEAGDLAGVIELIRAYPGEDDWCLGLLLLDPRHRGNGAGTRVMDAVEAWLLAEGAQAIFIAVQEQNGAARRFWERRGFVAEEATMRDTGRVFRMRKSLG
jgi:GNAT superfamily N-acetyltransferase